jgi:hypothetical protein
MKAVARLVLMYFTGTPLLLGFTIVGLILLAADLYAVATQPMSGETLWVAVFGMIFFLAGSSLMPVIVGRLTRSHSVGVLPGGRLKLLASVYVTILLVALPVGILAPASVSGAGNIADFVKYPRAREFILQVACLAFTSAVLTAGWIYLAMWFLTSQRNMAGLFKGLLVIMLVIFAPARDYSEFTVSLTWNLQQIAVIWVVFGIGFLLWPRFKRARARRNREPRAGLANMLSGRTVGREFDVLVGTSSPWLLVAALALPLLLAARLVRDMPSVWLYFLTIFSAVTGAYSGQAAQRSRALWLRGNWSRASLFSAVERSFWRHNGHVLGALVLVIVGIGISAGFSPALLAAGLPLLVLGTVLSTYLGLTITRGLGWLEIVGGIGVMVMLMALAVLVARERVAPVAVITLEVGMAIFAVVLRFVAQRRWARIDWILCRPERTLTGRGA